MNDVATEQRIRNYLAVKHSLAESAMDDWSESLAGLPWRYVPPLIEMAIHSGTHPITAMSATMKVSRDVQFVAAARKHLEE